MAIDFPELSLCVYKKYVTLQAKKVTSLITYRPHNSFIYITHIFQRSGYMEPFISDSF